MLSLTPAWAALHDESASDNPFAHPSWCTAWVDTYRSAHPRVLADVGCDGRLELVVPLTADRTHGRRWSTLGIPFVDFGDPLVRSGVGRAASVLDVFAGLAADWDTVVMAGLDASLANALAAAEDPGVACHLLGSEISPRIDLRSLDAWIQSLPNGRWKRLRTARRRVENRLNAVFSVVEAPEHIPDAIRRFDALRLQSWWQRSRLGELPPPIRTAAHGDFLRMTAERMAGYGAASVVEMTAGPRLLASSLLLWSGGSVLVALKATDMRLGASYSPGLALDVCTIEHAAAKGAGSVDFGRGDESYKFALGSQPRRTYDVMLAKPGARAPLAGETVRRLASALGYAWRTRT